MLKSQGWQSQSMARLSIGMSYYQDGYNINWLTRSKVLIGHPNENPERKPCKTDYKILGWSSLGLVDQVKLVNWGLVFSGLDRSDRSGGPVWPIQGATASFKPDLSALIVIMASFWKLDIYTPWPSLAGAAGSLAILELLEVLSWPASSLEHSLWVVLTRLHILWLSWEIECVWAKWPLWELYFEL